MVCLQPRTGKKGSGRPRAPGERSQAQPSRLPAAHHTSTAASWGSGSPCPQHPPGAPSLTARSQTQAPSAAPPPAGLGQGDWGKQRCHLPVQEARVPLSPPPSAHKAPFQAMEHTQERRPAAWGLRAKKCYHTGPAIWSTHVAFCHVDINKYHSVFPTAVYYSSRKHSIPIV